MTHQASLTYRAGRCTVREVCPEFPGHPQPVHWSIPDPAAQPDGYPAFQRTATELADRIRFLMFRVTAASIVEEL